MQLFRVTANCSSSLSQIVAVTTRCSESY